MVNTNKIKGRMVELGMTQKDLAKIMRLHQATISQKINNLRCMTLQEAFTLANALRIKDEDFRDYFFNNEVA